MPPGPKKRGEFVGRVPEEVTPNAEETNTEAVNRVGEPEAKRVQPSKQETNITQFLQVLQEEINNAVEYKYDLYTVKMSRIPASIVRLLYTEGKMYQTIRIGGINKKEIPVAEFIIRKLFSGNIHLILIDDPYNDSPLLCLDFTHDETSAQADPPISYIILNTQISPDTGKNTYGDSYPSKYSTNGEGLIDTLLGELNNPDQQQKILNRWFNDRWQAAPQMDLTPINNGFYIATIKMVIIGLALH